MTTISGEGIFILQFPTTPDEAPKALCEIPPLPAASIGSTIYDLRELGSDLSNPKPVSSKTEEGIGNILNWLIAGARNIGSTSNGTRYGPFFRESLGKQEIIQMLEKLEIVRVTPSLDLAPSTISPPPFYVGAENTVYVLSPKDDTSTDTLKTLEQGISNNGHRNCFPLKEFNMASLSPQTLSRVPCFHSHGQGQDWLDHLITDVNGLETDLSYMSSSGIPMGMTKADYLEILRNLHPRPVIFTARLG
ncbi:MAG: hypothetical protein KDJ50_02415 [Alphaproteobacteria bacterium]|nr:hypothetical protein [Alphaproteobacteria bacterium]